MYDGVAVDMEYEDVMDRIKNGQSWIMTNNGPRVIMPNNKAAEAELPEGGISVRCYCPLEG